MKDHYTKFHFGNVRGICVSEFQTRMEETILDWKRWVDHSENQVYMKRPNRVVGMDLPPPLTGKREGPAFRVVAKEFGWRSPLNRVLSPFFESSALRSFRVGSILYQRGIYTPRPLAAWEIRHMGFVTKNVYLYQEIPDAVLVRQVLKEHPERDKRLTPVLEDMARLVRGMHDAGIFHRDLTLGNFLATPSSLDSDTVRVAVIDLSRAVKLPSIPVFLRLADLARMKLLSHWDFFYNLYCYEMTAWKDHQPLLDRMIRFRRMKMALRKRFKRLFRGKT